MAGRNKRKEGGNFYRAALTEAERMRLPKAREAEGIDEEIAALRVKLFSAMQERPQRLQQLAMGMGMLVRMVAVRYRMSPESKEDLEASIAGVLNGIGRTMGLGEYRDAAEG